MSINSPFQNASFSALNRQITANPPGYRGNFLVNGSDSWHFTPPILISSLTNAKNAPIDAISVISTPQMYQNSGDGRVFAIFQYRSLLNGAEIKPWTTFSYDFLDHRGNFVPTREYNMRPGARFRVETGPNSLQTTLLSGQTLQIELRARVRHYAEATEPSFLRFYNGQIEISALNLE